MWVLQGLLLIIVLESNAVIMDYKISVLNAIM